jgi:acyl carrier protein
MSTVAIYSTEQIYQAVRGALAELFQIESARVLPETRLFEELQIDSIDAVDLMLKLEKTVGRKISAEEFHAVRTVNDLVQAIDKLQRG